MIDSGKILLVEDLILVDYPLKAGSQSQEIKDYIKTIDVEKLFKGYLDYYEATCLGYLDKIHPEK